MFQRINDYQNVQQALAGLCQGLVDVDTDATLGQSIDPQDIPDPYRALLVHRDHMTTRLSEHHGNPVSLKVLHYDIDGDVYRRKIVLSSSYPQKIVEFGLVRIDLRYTPRAVRDAIVKRETPLGDILIQHNVLRRIDPRWYVRMRSDCTLLQDLKSLPEQEVFGRVGTIYCDEQPAVELLEVVMNG